MNLKPLSNHALIEPAEEASKTTKSGIVLPDSADKKKQSRGTIVAVGPGKANDAGVPVPMAVKAGDQVLFKEPWSEDNKIEDGDKKYFLVEEEDILGIIG